MIEDNPYSPFPQILSTERPDITCANLLEGRAVILVDGTPFSLIAPISFFSLIQSHEDYYQRYMVGTLIRWLRYFFLTISLLLPSFYVAILTFYQEMVPAALLLSMAASREAVPFPAIVEALLMEISFEALREAGVRLPKQIGSAVSIVGALVIGQAACSGRVSFSSNGHCSGNYGYCFIYDSKICCGDGNTNAAFSHYVACRYIRITWHYDGCHCDSDSFM